MKLLSLVTSIVLCSTFYGKQSESCFASQKNVPNLISFAAGDYNVFHTASKENTGMVQLEVKGPPVFDRKYFKVRAFGAGLVNFQGSLWIGGGVDFDIWFGRPFVMTLGIGPGYFSKGKGKDLGYPMEVRSSVEFAYQTPKLSRVGLKFYHLSNASFSSKNPGVECLLLFYAIPI